MLKPFLTANWRYLAMLNFIADPKIQSLQGVTLTGATPMTADRFVGQLYQELKSTATR